MNEYWLEDFNNKENYLQFVEYMVEKSDAFSLVYFRYHKSEKIKSNVKEIKTLLRPFLIKSWYGTKWASMETLNEKNHLYQIATYRSERETSKALGKARCIFDWDYPNYPMDLCFFKNGTAWFSSSSHERTAYLYTENQQAIKELEDLGAKITLYDNVDPSFLFYEENAIVKL